MPSLGYAPAWQTDAFTEIFTSSANKIYGVQTSAVVDTGMAQEVEVYTMNDSTSDQAIANVVHRSHNYQGKRCNVKMQRESLL